MTITAKQFRERLDVIEKIINAQEEKNKIRLVTMYDSKRVYNYTHDFDRHIDLDQVDTVVFFVTDVMNSFLASQALFSLIFHTFFFYTDSDYEENILDKRLHLFNSTFYDLVEYAKQDDNDFNADTVIEDIVDDEVYFFAEL